MTLRIQKVNEAPSGTTLEVSIDGPPATTHSVTVTADYARQLTGGRVPVETLIERSFEFLLERESNTSILRSFDLPVIQRYFPEYERVMAALLQESPLI